MVELPVGTRFLFDNKLVEVIEDKNTNCYSWCSGCVFKNKSNFKYCDVLSCVTARRTDGKNIIFKEVKNE